MPTFRERVNRWGSSAWAGIKRFGNKAVRTHSINSAAMGTAGKQAVSNITDARDARRQLVRESSSTMEHRLYGEMPTPWYRKADRAAGAYFGAGSKVVKSAHNEQIGRFAAEALKNPAFDAQLANFRYITVNPEGAKFTNKPKFLPGVGKYRIRTADVIASREYLKSRPTKPPVAVPSAPTAATPTAPPVAKKSPKPKKASPWVRTSTGTKKSYP